MYIRLETGRGFAFAGLWDIWHASDGSEIHSCTIITTQPNSLIARIHNRMPVILPTEVYSAGLDPGEIEPTNLSQYLTAYPAEEMMAYPVSRAVNSPQNDSPALISHAE